MLLYRLLVIPVVVQLGSPTNGSEGARKSQPDPFAQQVIPILRKESLFGRSSWVYWIKSRPAVDRLYFLSSHSAKYVQSPGFHVKLRFHETFDGQAK